MGGGGLLGMDTSCIKQGQRTVGCLLSDEYCGYAFLTHLPIPGNPSSVRHLPSSCPDRSCTQRRSDVRTHFLISRCMSHFRLPLLE